MCFRFVLFSKRDDALGAAVAKQAAELTSVYAKLETLETRLRAMETKQKWTTDELQTVKTELENKMAAVQRSKRAAMSTDQGQHWIICRQFCSLICFFLIYVSIWVVRCLADLLYILCCHFSCISLRR